jgi:hypothetical protein
MGEPERIPQGVPVAAARHAPGSETQVCGCRRCRRNGQMGLGHVELAMVQPRRQGLVRTVRAQLPSTRRGQHAPCTGRRRAKEKYLRPLCDGHKMSTTAMTEPEGAGSDPTLIGRPPFRTATSGSSTDLVVHLQRGVRPRPCWLAPRMTLICRRPQHGVHRRHPSPGWNGCGGVCTVGRPQRDRDRRPPTTPSSSAVAVRAACWDVSRGRRS